VGLLEEVFKDALNKAKANVTDAVVGLNSLLQQYLQQLLAEDLRRHMERSAGGPVYGHSWKPSDPGTAADADPQANRQARDTLKRDLAANNPEQTEAEAEGLLRHYALLGHLLRPLTFGLIGAATRSPEDPHFSCIREAVHTCVARGS
jgi:hypothetical protein